MTTPNAEANGSENEGGAPSPRVVANLPVGITAIAVTHYQVGPHRYTSLPDAMAQLQRLNKANA